jgi:hypothetical protein
VLGNVLLPSIALLRIGDHRRSHGLGHSPPAPERREAPHRLSAAGASFTSRLRVGSGQVEPPAVGEHDHREQLPRVIVLLDGWGLVRLVRFQERLPTRE